MNRLLLCNALFIKRSVKKISFLLLLLSIPVLCYLLKDNVRNTTTSSIHAGIYIENKDSVLVNQLVNNIVGQYGSISYEVCDNFDTLKKNVMNGAYECGYVFPEDFDEKIAVNDTHHLIDSYVSPGTRTSTLTNEYVFAEIFNEYVFNRLINYIRNDEVFKGKDLSNLEDELRPSFEAYLASDDMFFFQYVNAKTGAPDSDVLFTSFTLSSVKGLIALFIMFAAFMGTLNLYKDDNIGIFSAFGSRLQPFAKMAEIFTMTLLSSVSGLATIYLCGLSDGLLLEFLRLLVYTVICTVYFYMIYKVAPNQYIFAALIPMLILGSMIFCPIFLDTSEFIPLVKYISWIFAPKYYFLF